MSIHADNCMKLAQFIDKKVPAKQYKHECWAETNCTTKGCALGWAAMSGLFKQIKIQFPEAGAATWQVPTIVGANDEYLGRFGLKSVAAGIFGPKTYVKVFDYNSGIKTKKQAVKVLRQLAKVYRANESLSS